MKQVMSTLDEGQPQVRIFGFHSDWHRSFWGYLTTILWFFGLSFINQELTIHFGKLTKQWGSTRVTVTDPGDRLPRSSIIHTDHIFVGTLQVVYCKWARKFQKILG